MKYELSNQNVFAFLFRRFVFLNEIGGCDAHISLELSAEEIHVRKIAHFGDLGDRIALRAQKIAGVVDLELNDVPFGRDAVYP